MSAAFADSEFGEAVDSQLTLGTASLLGIFFGLVMICGIFFGFGYSIGRRSSTSLASASIRKNVPAPTVATPALPPPAARQLVASLTPVDASTVPDLQRSPDPAALTMPHLASPRVTAGEAVPQIAPHPAPAPAIVAKPVAVSNAAASGISRPPIADAKMRLPKPSAFQPLTGPQDAQPSSERIVAGPQFTSQTMPSPYFVWTPPFDVHRRHPVVHAVLNPGLHAALQRAALQHPALTVQIAALSREDDAEVLASALRKGGFAPSIRNGAEDTLYHVQVGPFNRELAFATRQRLIAHGYNAILK